MPIERIWLDVPYAEKDKAKGAGARWDPENKRWYAPRLGMRELDHWAPRPDVPELLPGEDRSFGSGLFVDLVPSSCWFTNVRWCVDQRDWGRLRNMINTRAGNRCEVCSGNSGGLEAHERWSFDDRTMVQTLRRLVCLCADCHTVTHFGLAQVKGRDEEAFAHLRAVTGMSDREARNHVQDAFTVWERRSHVDWTLDLGILTGAGITVQPPPEAASRANLASHTLQRERPSASAETSATPRISGFGDQLMRILGF